jgi:hypothetical protein
LERAMGIEPTSEAWEASILPLNYARSIITKYEVNFALMQLTERELGFAAHPVRRRYIERGSFTPSRLSIERRC